MIDRIPKDVNDAGKGTKAQFPLLDQQSLKIDVVAKLSCRLSRSWGFLGHLTATFLRVIFALLKQHRALTTIRICYWVLYCHDIVRESTGMVFKSLSNGSNEGRS